MIKIRVPGHRVLIKPDPIEEVSAGGIVLAKPGNQAKLEVMATETGTVVDLGPTCWLNYDRNQPEWTPWCKPGDRVIFAKYAGLRRKGVDGKEYLVINDKGACAVLT